MTSSYPKILYRANEQGEVETREVADDVGQSVAERQGWGARRKAMEDADAIKASPAAKASDKDAALKAAREAETKERRAREEGEAKILVLGDRVSALEAFVVMVRDDVDAPAAYRSAALELVSLELVAFTGEAAPAGEAPPPAANASRQSKPRGS